MSGAGLLRERLRFEVRKTQTDDGYGNVEGVWESQFEARARVKPMRGTETVIAQRLAGVQPVTITVYSCTDTRQVTPAWRAVDARSGTVYNIRSSANPDERNRMIDFTAESGVPT